MPIKQLPTHFFAPVLIAVLLVTFCGRAYSTTVVSVINGNGIVLLSDSKTSIAEGGKAGRAMCQGKDVKKVFIIQERWGIAASDSTCFQYIVVQNRERTAVSFDFPVWIHELESNLPKNISFDQFAQTVTDKFAELVPKLKIVVAENRWGKPQNPGENFERLITFSITGYDKGVPRLAVVKFYIDWSTKTILAPHLIPIELGPINTGTNFNYAGMSEAISDFHDSESYAHKQAMAIDPATFTNYFSRRRLPTLDESVSIARALVEIEETIRPDAVGGAIRGVKISPDGKATEVDFSLPKPVAEQPKGK